MGRENISKCLFVLRNLQPISQSTCQLISIQIKSENTITLCLVLQDCNILLCSSSPTPVPILGGFHSDFVGFSRLVLSQVTIIRLLSPEDNKWRHEYHTTHYGPLVHLKITSHLKKLITHFIYYSPTNFNFIAGLRTKTLQPHTPYHKIVTLPSA